MTSDNNRNQHNSQNHHQRNDDNQNHHQRNNHQHQNGKDSTVGGSALHLIHQWNANLSAVIQLAEMELQALGEFVFVSSFKFTFKIKNMELTHSAVFTQVLLVQTNQPSLWTTGEKS